MSALISEWVWCWSVCGGLYCVGVIVYLCVGYNRRVDLYDIVYLCVCLEMERIREREGEREIIILHHPFVRVFG